jgi:hypothetical protein
MVSSLSLSTLCIDIILYINIIGVTHLPEIHRVELLPIFYALTSATASSASSSTATSSSSSSSSSSSTASSASSSLSSSGPVDSIAQSTIAVVVATDGVWDNWLYEDVGRFILDASCLNAIAQAHDGAQKVMTSFMIRNMQFSKKNFGNQADNATGIVLYLSHSPSFAT